jgi:hypothetical protein
MWHLSSGYVSPPNIGQQISDILFGLPSDPHIWNLLGQRFDCWITVGAYFADWAGGLVLEPSTLGLLAERKLAVDLDLYAPAASS